MILPIQMPHQKGEKILLVVVPVVEVDLVDLAAVAAEEAVPVMKLEGQRTVAPKAILGQRPQRAIQFREWLMERRNF